ncbi:F-box domain containing protein [Tanacetum coccineum]
MNVQDDDRLNNLPDDLIHKILSLVGTKLAVQTSALSSRWRYLWTMLPYLNLSSEDFKTLPKFSNFVTHVLSCRDNQIEISSAKLNFRGKGSQEFVTKILNYVFSHNVKQLTISCLPEFPLSLFSSQSLEHLTFTGFASLSSVILTLTWELTSLTTLHLESITFKEGVTAKDTGIFSKCANLKKLVLNKCGMRRSNDVDICHPRLTNLTLVNGTFFENFINVVAPQLKDLTVRDWQGLHLIFLHLACVPSAFSSFSIMELIAYQPSPFVNLKSLKVYPDHWSCVETIPAEVYKKYLLDGSPSATFIEVSYEEVRALRNAESTVIYMAELRRMLEHYRVMSLMECHLPNMHEQDKMQNKWEMRDQIDSCLKDL